MNISARAMLLLIPLAASVSAAGNQVVARYLPLGTSGSARAMVQDSSGNLFTIGTVVEPSGLPQIRAIKTDPQGNVIASFDFGGSFRGSLYASADSPAGAAVDPQGNLVVVGTTSSSDFPLVSPLMSQMFGTEGFVAKLDSQLTKILFSTYLGPQQELPQESVTGINAVALDTAGNIYVTGSTISDDFPVTPGAFQTLGPAQSEFLAPVYAFLTEIAANGSSIVYSTYFGSSFTDCLGGNCINATGITSGNAIAVDSAGAVVIAGNTTASQLPVTPGTLGQQCDCTSNLNEPDQLTVQSGFLAKFAVGGQQLDWATYIPLAQIGPPSNYELSINAAAIDAQGDVIFGGAASLGLAITNGALQPSFPGGNSSSSNASDGGFLAKIDPSATGYLFSTYLGAVAFGSPNGVAALVLDPQGGIWLTGGSSPSALPFPSSIPLLGPTYVAELSDDGSSVLNGFTAPAGAAGQALVLTANGSATLGSTGSLLLNLPDQPASFVGITNSASIQVSGSVAPYELVSLYGIGLGPSKGIGGQIANGVLQNLLGGVQVLFNDVAAPLLYVGPNQINAVVPSNVASEAAVSLLVVTPNGKLTVPSLSVVPSEPEVFQDSALSAAGGPAIALNQDGSLNSSNNPASGGSVVTVWAAGAGLDNSADEQDGFIATFLAAPVLPVSVLNSSVSGIYSLEVLYAGTSPGMVTGALQVNFLLPQSPFDVSQLTCQLQVGMATSSPFSIYVQP